MRAGGGTLAAEAGGRHEKGGQRTPKASQPLLEAWARRGFKSSKNHPLTIHFRSVLKVSDPQAASLLPKVLPMV